MALSIIALFIFIFGAYAYGQLVVLQLFRARRAEAPTTHASTDTGTSKVESLMFVTCTVWFVLLAVIELRRLLGDTARDDFFDLAVLEITAFFPALILHSFVSDARWASRPAEFKRGWRWVLVAMYAAGLVAASYFLAVIFGWLAVPRAFGLIIAVSVGSLYTITSICCLLLLQNRSRAAVDAEPRGQRGATRALLLLMLVIAGGGFALPEQFPLARSVEIAAKSLPVAFMLVAVYFESRVAFFDLVIKRGLLLILTLLTMAAAAAFTIGWLDAAPAPAARPWLLAVLLLPAALLMPWLHSRFSQVLDRLWLGRLFTPVDAIKHVLSGMQSAHDERSLVAATESALSDIFRRPIRVLADNGQSRDPNSAYLDVRLPEDRVVRFEVRSGAGHRSFLSEDAALLRSLGNVFGSMLENVRLQQRRQEQDQLAQQLRLQTSRSELKALRAQINPHFLFNALNAIASLIHTDPARADAAVEQLADVFRYTLKRSEQEWAPLDQELALAKAYLEVEQARFGPRLSVAIDSDAAAARAQVPAMLLQTLVENAVKHGVSQQRGPGRIVVNTHVSGPHLTLEVRDTGPGLPPAGGAARGEGGFGLRSVRERLRGPIGDRASLDLTRDGSETVARIQLPFIEELAPVVGARS